MLIGAAAIALSLSSCKFLEAKYSKNSAATVAYLKDNKTAPAKSNLEGVWYSPQWGMIIVNQEAGGKLSGVFQDYYTVDGVISGNDAYIALIDDDWTEYTVKLHRQNSEYWTGYYSSSVPFSEKDQTPLVLKRIDR